MSAKHEGRRRAEGARTGGGIPKGLARLVLSFVGLVILFDLFIWHLARKEYLAFLDTFTAYAVTAMIRSSGVPAVRDSNVIQLTNSVWIVSVECTAIYLLAIYASFILAYPASLRAKACALCSGVPFLFGANLFRLFALSWVDLLAPSLSGYFHSLVWQGGFVIMIIGMWLVWIEKVVHRAVEAGAAR